MITKDANTFAFVSNVVTSVHRSNVFSLFQNFGSVDYDQKTGDYARGLNGYTDISSLDTSSYTGGNLTGTSSTPYTSNGWTVYGIDNWNTSTSNGNLSSTQGVWIYASGTNTGYIEKQLPSNANSVLVGLGEPSTGTEHVQVWIYNGNNAVTGLQAGTLNTSNVYEYSLSFNPSANNKIRLQEAGSGVMYISYIITGEPPPSIPELTHNGYNKLNITGITPTSSNLTLGSNVYELGTASTVYIEDTGTYDVTARDADSFAFMSNVVGNVSSTPSPILRNTGNRVGAIVDENGNMYMWGDNGVGQLGQGTASDNIKYPVRVNSWTSQYNYLINIVDYVHSMNTDADFTLACESVYGYALAWGSNRDGALGQGNTSGGYVNPVTVRGVGGIGVLGNIVGVSAGWFHSLAVDSSGNVYAWGNNIYGALGQGNTTNSTTPLQVVGVGGTGYLTNIKQVAGREYSSYAVTNGGDVYAWGSGSNNGLGQGNNNNSNTPIQMKGVGGSGFLTNISKLSRAGGNYMLALGSNGKVYDWIGGSMRVVPGVGGSGDLSNIIDVECGSYTMFALDSSGNVYAWGYNVNGTFGNGTTDTVNFYSTPVAVSISDVVNIGAGGEAGYAIKSNGDVWAWGRNVDGEIGDNTLTIRTTPVQVLGVDGTGYLNVGGLPPTLTHDGYNKLSINNLTPTSSTLQLESNTYELGSASNVYITDTGTYDVTMKDANIFAFASNTVSTVVNPLLTVFHHGNFDDAYSDGDVTTAAGNGHIYADTPTGSYSWGTLSAVSQLPSPTMNVSFRLNQYTQGTSTESETTGIMLTEIDVYDTNNTLMTFGTDYRADLYRCAFADNSGDGGSGSLSDDTTPFNDDGSRLDDNTLHGSGGYIGWVNGTYNASNTGLNRRYPYNVDDELIRIVPLGTKTIDHITLAYKGTGTTPGWKVYAGDNLIETTNYAGTDINNQGNQVTHNISISATTYTWTPPSTLTANVLMVAGGGCGGKPDNANGGGAGGGAGGLIFNQNVTISGQKTITVGGGGQTSGTDGYDTTFTGLTTVIGGGAGGAYGSAGNNGGSGGGGGRSNSGGSGTPGQGNDGGSGSTTYSPASDQGGSGGGGAGGAGAGAVDGNGANGGAGADYSSAFGTTYGDSGYFASGGAGGYHSGTNGTASSGGGGDGGVTGNGQNHTGGGGGGGYLNNFSSHGVGGSGIVIVQVGGPPLPTDTAPYIAYDNLNEVNMSGNDSGADIVWYDSNNSILACGTDMTSLTLTGTGTYYAVAKGSSNYTFKTNQVSVSDIVPLYQYPPIGGTTSSLTTSATADTNSTWTISGATYGNGEYNTSSNIASNSPGGSLPASPYGLFDNSITVTGTNNTLNYGFWQGQYQRIADVAITTILPSEVVVRKYILWPLDTSLSGTQAPGSSTDPALSGNSGQDSSRRPKSWILKGSNDGTTWTNLHSVTNQPSSIYGDIHTVSSPGSYSQYKLDILTNNGSTEFIQLGELQFWGDVPLTGGTFSDGWTSGDTSITNGTTYTIPTYTTAGGTVLTASGTLDTNTNGTYILYWSYNDGDVTKRISRNFVVS